jgi:hypothetical protein
LLNFHYSQQAAAGPTQSTAVGVKVAVGLSLKSKSRLPDDTAGFI